MGNTKSSPRDKEALNANSKTSSEHVSGHPKDPNNNSLHSSKSNHINNNNNNNNNFSPQTNENHPQNNSTNSLSKSRKRKPIRLLLLGAGESGKSTILKQARILFLNGFSEEERHNYAINIQQNIINFIKSLILASSKLSITFPPDLEELTNEIADLSISEPLTENITSNLSKIWKAPQIQQVWKHRAEFQTYESCSYFFTEPNALQRALARVPTNQDILLSRTKTTKIIEVHWTWENAQFVMTDVGGQRDERGQWAHCLEDVTGVIFCCAVNEYDMTLYEDPTVMRMDESRKLFSEVCSAPFFSNSFVFLFLNKVDLFKEKIQHVDLSCYFKHYKGGCNYENAMKYIIANFKKLAKKQNRKEIYVHVTTAVDTHLMKDILGAVRKSILDSILKTQQLY